MKKTSAPKQPRNVQIDDPDNVMAKHSTSPAQAFSRMVEEIKSLFSFMKRPKKKEP